MPIYEYKCESCGHELEALQKISDDPLKECPSCHQETLKKKVSAAAFRLKGGGWYETDFKSGKQKNLAGDKSAGKASPSSETASSKPSEKKAATPAGQSGNAAKK